MWSALVIDDCRIEDMTNKRLMAVEISNRKNCKLLVMNMYMPVNKDENKDEFLYHVSV